MEILDLIIGLVIGLGFGWVIKLLISKSESGRFEERNKLLENSNSVNEAQLSAKCEKVMKPNAEIYKYVCFATIKKNGGILL